MKHWIGKRVLHVWRWYLETFLFQAGSLGALLLLPPVALLARGQTILSRVCRRRPRLIWGPVPIMSLKYWSGALRERGYKSVTCVYNLSAAGTRHDFDICRPAFLGSLRLALAFGDYLVFARTLLKADVFISFLEGSFLHRTRLQRLEGPLLRLAGKKLVVSPYGSDVTVPGHLGALEEQMLAEYPVFLEIGDQIRERVDYYCRWADLVIGNWHQLGYLPRTDVLWPTMLAIDTEQWPEVPPGGGDGHDGPVTVVHAPNHRLIKGTEGLIEAVEELRAEGLDVHLDLLERRPNEEVRQAILRADIVADQFVTGYAMFAIEGMSAGKPVLSALSWLPADYMQTEAMRASPVVNADLTNLKQVLRELVENPAERRRVGRAGREFVLDYHSFDAVGRGWELILDHLWRGAPLPAELPPAPEGDLAPGAPASEIALSG